MPSEPVSLHPLDILVIIAYLVAMLLMGFYLGKRIKTEKDYFLAGRSLPFWAIGLSIVGTDIGAVDFVGLVGQTYRYGIVMGNMDWIGSMPALLLAAFVFVPYFWRAGVYTVPEYLGLRYNQGVRLIQSVAWTVFFALNLGNMLWATAVMLRAFVGLNEWVTIWTTAGVVGIYTISGGLLAVVYTDVVQVIIMFIGGFLVLILGIVKIGGIDELYTRILAQGHENHFTLYFPTDTTTPYSWTMILLGLTCVSAPAYFIGNQSLMQRCLGARDEWSAKASALFGCLFKFGIPFIVVMPGLVGLALYPDLEAAGIKDPDDVFSHMVKDLLPIGLRGLVLTAFFAGLMSSADSALNSAATLITKDLYVGILGAKPDDRKVLFMGRWITLILIVAAASCARLTESFTGVYAAIQSFLAVVQGPSFGILLPGMMWARATPAGGLVSLVVGLASSLSMTVYQKMAPGWGLEQPFNADEPFFAIAFISFSITLLVNIAVSLLTRPRSPEELRGLVYRWTYDDPEAQAALRDRA